MPASKNKQEKKAKFTHLDFFNKPVEEAISLVNERYGENTLIKAAQIAPKLVRIPTGVATLDFALGGGWPRGRFAEIHGPKSSFKSTTSLTSMRSFQHHYPEGQGIYVDLERTFDRTHSERLGVDSERLMVLNPDSGEQAVDAMNDVISFGCDLFIIIDSLAALIPTVEIEGSMDQQMMGIHARLVNRMFRILTARMKRNLYDDDAPAVTVIVLNQLREKIGVMFGNPEYTPGGRGKEFAYSVIVRLSVQNSKAITEKIERNGISRDVQFGQTIGFRVSKNKCGGPPNETGEFQFIEREWRGHKPFTFDNDTPMFEYGAFYNVIKHSAKTGYEFEEIQAAKQNGFLKLLRRSKPIVRSRLRQAIIKAMNNPRAFEQVEDEKDAQ